MTADSTEDLDLALELADLADAVSLARFRAVDLDVQTKPDRTPVTEADLAVERAIRDRHAEARPGDGILGEEFGTEGDSTRQWIIDPIDGTANFLRGVPVWGTLIALAIDGVPVVGPRVGEPVADRALDREVRLGDRCAVGLRLHVEVDGAEAGERGGVGEIGQFEGEIEVFGEVCGHPIKAIGPLRAVGRGSSRRPRPRRRRVAASAATT